MDERRWEELVRQLDVRAREDPRAYRRRVAAIAALGYAYIGAALLLLLALAGAVVYLLVHHPGPLIKLLIPIGAATWAIVSSLAVRIEPPGGVPLTRAEAPALLALLDEVNGEVRGPKVHRVLLDGQLNAAIVQVPRLVVFGTRNYLLIGLPLLQALPLPEFRAVLAHELAHLSRSHGRFGTWLYRVSATWWQLLGALEQKRSWATLLFRRFFEWYVPRFNAHTFPLLRTHEFEADRIAARAAGGETLARALARVTVADRFLETRYWPSVYRRAADEPTPAAAAFAGMAREVGRASGDADAGRWIEQELRREPAAADSHPSLAERLAALDVAADKVKAPADTGAESAAGQLLGDAQVALAERLDADWRREIAPAWNEEHLRAVGARAELETLEGREGLDADERLRLAELTDELRDPDDALERFRDVLELRPDDAVARFATGRILLARGDDAGLAELDRAMDVEPEAVLTACGLAETYLLDAGRDVEAERYRERATRRAELLMAAGAERETYTAADAIEPAELTEEARAGLSRVLARFPEVKRAYVVRKRLEHLADEYPHYVVGVVTGRSKRKDDEPSLAHELAEALELPGDFHVVVRRSRSSEVRRFAETAGEPVFSRD